MDEGIAACRDAAISWFAWTLTLVGDIKGAGYWRGESQGASLYNGLAGVALSLLAALVETEPEWDRMMRLSGYQCEEIRPRPHALVEKLSSI
jgi:hypothetical protein